MLKFPTETVDEHITRIYAFGTELMYLIEGTKKNVLIDTGSGFGSLKGAVDEILAAHNNTNPLEVLLTHGHVDHANGSEEFVKAGIPVYLSEKDRYIYVQHFADAFRKGGLGVEEFEGHGTYVEEEDYIPSAKFETFRNLQEGDTFALGGVTVQTYACPGHTLGSMIFLIREEQGETYLLTGDACNTFTFLFQEYSTSIEAYEETLQHVAETLKGKYTKVLLSHGDGNGYIGILEDVCNVCEEIKTGKAEGLPFDFQGAKGKIAHVPGPDKGNIVYNEERIWKKDTVIS